MRNSGSLRSIEGRLREVLVEAEKCDPILQSAGMESVCIANYLIDQDESARVHVARKADGTYGLKAKGCGEETKDGYNPIRAVSRYIKRYCDPKDDLVETFYWEILSEAGARREIIPLVRRGIDSSLNTTS